MANKIFSVPNHLKTSRFTTGELVFTIFPRGNKCSFSLFCDNKFVVCDCSKKVESYSFCINHAYFYINQEYFIKYFVIIFN